MNINAEDKATKKTNKITITNNKGRLSKEEIEKLVKEAEKFKGEDEIIKKKIEAKNGLEQTIYHIKNTVNDEKLKDKFSADEKQKLSTLAEETKKWVDSHQDSGASEFEAK